MAEKRKLQAEIDRCLKKVSEGVEVFDETWAKVQDATQNNQKEKFENDLKKEIKKLQRHRDQIKTWIASNEIKDKQILQDKRRLIEQKMEQFKVVEREMKMKAFSKTGLSAEQKVDPREKEKEDVNAWLQDCIEKLNIEKDQFEGEIESVYATSKRKRLDKDKQDKILDFKAAIEKHTFHIQRLELLMRLLDNDSIDLDKVKEIREDVDHYIEHNQEPDFQGNDEVYDDLNLDVDEMTQQLGTVAPVGSLDEGEAVNSETATTASTSPSASPGPGHVKDTTRESSISEDAVNSSTNNISAGSVQRKRVTPASDDVRTILANKAAASTGPRSTPTTPLRLTGHSTSERAVSTPPPASASTPSPSTAAGPPSSYNLALSQGVSSPASGLSPSSVSSPGLVHHHHHHHQQPVQQAPIGTAAPSVAAPVHGGGSSSSGSSGSNSTSAAGASLLVAGVPPPVAVNGGGSGSAAPSSAGSPLISLQHQHQQSSGSSVQGLLQQSGGSAGPAGLNNYNNNTTSTTTGQSGGGVVVAHHIGNNCQSPQSLRSIAAAQVMAPTAESVMGISAADVQQLLSADQPPPADVRISPHLGASPLGSVRVPPEMQQQRAMLTVAASHLPHPADSERMRVYMPRIPASVPYYYPQVPPPNSDTPDFFAKFAPETLFFVFYYMEGTKAQYLAAQALKRQSWRFHTKYKMWFQRHEEPKQITDEYENGTYIYFDFEKWAQRKKEGFVFEYKFLEDIDLP